MILVTAAYGTQGRRLIPRLAEAGAQVRALRQNPGGEDALRALGAHEIVIGDAEDPAVLRAALSGVDAVYHVGPSAHPAERQMGFAMIEAALAAGVSHLVFSSVLHPVLTGLVQHALKRDIEERLIESGVPFTILQPADYMQVLRCRRAFETGEFQLAWNIERRQSVVDVDDIAEVAAKVLLEGAAHHGATYELAAPGCYSGHDIGAIIARVTERPIRVVEVDPAERMRDHFADTPGGAYQLSVFRAIRDWYGRHDFVGNPNVLGWLLGRQPTTLEAYVAGEYHRFLAEAG